MSKINVDTSPEACIKRFQEFLRIKTITIEGPKGANYEAIEYIKKWAESINLSHQVFEYKKGYPVIVVSYLANQSNDQPKLPSILLNCHYDVVPVMAEHWTVDPFAATINENGEIMARGSQDMKCVCSSYMEAITQLVLNNQSQPTNAFKRDIHISFVPDEETGGFHGTAQWVHGPDFASFNVGFALDEGLANPEDVYTVFYGERAVWWTHITARGPTGHGSRLIPDTANEKLLRVINKLYDFRATQVAKLQQDNPSKHVACKHTLGDVVTVNCTMLKSGVTGDNGETYSINVIPMVAEAGFDIRIPPEVPLDQFERMLQEWTSDPEGSITYDFYQKVTVHSSTSIDPLQNPYWGTFQNVMKELGRTIDPQIFPAGTDGRYLREIGIPVLGFSPIRKQPILLHDHDERLHKDVFLEGIDVYVKLVAALANMD